MLYMILDLALLHNFQVDNYKDLGNTCINNFDLYYVMHWKVISTFFGLHDSLSK
jgi:hypothetical protein